MRSQTESPIKWTSPINFNDLSVRLQACKPGCLQSPPGTRKYIREEVCFQQSASMGVSAQQHPWPNNHFRSTDHWKSAVGSTDLRSSWWM